MGVEDTLGIARSRRRVANDRRIPLVEVRRLENVGLGGQELLVVTRLWEGWTAPAHRHDDAVFSVRRSGKRRRERAAERGIEENGAILRVVEDEGHLLGEEADVDGVKHGADRRYGIVELEMPMRVPRKGCHAVTLPDAKAPEGIGQTRDATAELGIREAVKA